MGDYRYDALTEKQVYETAISLMQSAPLSALATYDKWEVLRLYLAPLRNIITERYPQFEFISAIMGYTRYLSETGDPAKLSLIMPIQTITKIEALQKANELRAALDPYSPNDRLRIIAIILDAEGAMWVATPYMTRLVALMNIESESPMTWEPTSEIL